MLIIKLQVLPGWQQAGEIPDDQQGWLLNWLSKVGYTLGYNRFFDNE